MRSLSNLFDPRQPYPKGVKGGGRHPPGVVEVVVGRDGTHKLHVHRLYPGQDALQKRRRGMVQGRKPCLTVWSATILFSWDLK